MCSFFHTCYLSRQWVVDLVRWVESLRLLPCLTVNAWRTTLLYYVCVQVGLLSIRTVFVNWSCTWTPLLVFLGLTPYKIFCWPDLKIFHSCTTFYYFPSLWSDFFWFFCSVGLRYVPEIYLRPNFLFYFFVDITCDDLVDPF